MKLKYNLQFFAEENEDVNTESNDDTNNDNGGNSNEIDASAFADLISEKDKQISELQSEVAKLKKTSAELLVKVSAGASATPKKSFEENLLDMVGAKPRKEK